MAYFIKNEEKNGIEIYFEKKPSDDILEQLYEYHWHWFKTKKCWYHKFSETNLQFAIRITGTSERKTISVVNSSQSKQIINVYKFKYRIPDNIFERDLDKEKQLLMRALSELKDKGYIERVGSDKTGFWKVLK